MALGLTAPALAQSPYGDVVSAEILPGWETPEGTHMAGLRLVLADGWKTYWRAPGDSGIPPAFDWTGSDNLENVTLHWPRPEVFYQNGMRSIGYQNEVVIPLELTPTHAAQDITMQGQVTLGVCLDVCVPMSFDLSVALPAPAQAEPIQAALDSRPDSAAQAGVGQVTCDAEPIEDGLRLTAQIPMAALGTEEIVVVETANAEVWVAEAQVARNGDALTAVTDLVPPNAAPFDLDPASVRITILAGDQAVDITGCAFN